MKLATVVSVVPKGIVYKATAVAQGLGTYTRIFWTKSSAPKVGTTISLDDSWIKE